jgi:hypothetical protein
MYRGAWNEKTKSMVSAFVAKKEDQEYYKCSDIKCREPLVFCKGDFKLEYFRHYPSSTCKNYKERISNEGELHKRAKEVVKELLDNGAMLDIERRCGRCRKTKIHSFFKGDCEIVLECRLDPPYETRVADIALVNPDKTIKSIIEIYSSNETNEENRPDDIEWCEINTKQFNDEFLNEKIKKSVNDNIVINFDCNRKWTCFECIKKMELIRIEAEQRAYAIECKRQERLEQERLRQIKIAYEKEKERKKQEKERKDLFKMKTKLKKLCNDVDKLLGLNQTSYILKRTKTFTLDIRNTDIFTYKRLFPELVKLVKSYFPKYKILED